MQATPCCTGPVLQLWSPPWDRAATWVGLGVSKCRVVLRESPVPPEAHWDGWLPRSVAAQGLQGGLY